MTVSSERILRVVVTAAGYADNLRVVTAVPGGSEHLDINLRLSDRTYISADEGIITGLIASLADLQENWIRITPTSTDEEIKESLALINENAALHNDTADGTLNLSFGYSAEDNAAILTWDILAFDEVIYDPGTYASSSAMVEISGTVLNATTSAPVFGALFEIEGKQVTGISDSQGEYGCLFPVAVGESVKLTVSAAGYADNQRLLRDLRLGDVAHVDVLLKPVSDRTYVSADEGIISGLLARAEASNYYTACQCYVSAEADYIVNRIVDGVKEQRAYIKNGFDYKWAYDYVKTADRVTYYDSLHDVPLGATVAYEVVAGMSPYMQHCPEDFILSPLAMTKDFDADGDGWPDFEADAALTHVWNTLSVISVSGRVKNFFFAKKL